MKQKLELEEAIRVAVTEEWDGQDLLVINNKDFGHRDSQWVMPLGGRVGLDPMGKRLKLLNPVCE